MFSTFVAWSALSTAMGFWPALFLTLLSAQAMGALVEWLIVRRVEGTGDLNSLIVALGLFLVFDGLAFTYGGRCPGIRPFSVFSGGASCAGYVCIGRLNWNPGGIGHHNGPVVPAVQRTGLGWRCGQAPKTGWPAGWWAYRWADVEHWVGAGDGGGRHSRILAAQSLGLDSRTMFFVLLFALAAAALGGLDSPVGAVVGGLIIGVVKTWAGTYTPSSVGSIDLAVAFAVIVLVLMVRPTGIFGRPTRRRV